MIVSAASRSIQQTCKVSNSSYLSLNLKRFLTSPVEVGPYAGNSSGKMGDDLSKVSAWAPTLLAIGAAVVGYGYKRLEDRDNVIEGKIDKVNDRIDKVNDRIDTVNDRIDKVNENMLDMRKEHNAQMLELSTQVATFSGKLDVLIDSSRPTAGKGS